MASTGTGLATRPQNGAASLGFMNAQQHGGIDILALADALAKSGYFKDATEPAKALVKILAGQEIGIGPTTAMTSIHIVEGKPTYSATLIGAQIKRSGRYSYRVTRLDDDGCEIAFFERDNSIEGGQWVEIGRSAFTMQNATDANLTQKQVWKSYRRNMLFARALSNGCRWYTPDIFGGMPAYTPEELGAEVNGESGEVISFPPPMTAPALPRPAAAEPQQPTAAKPQITPEEAASRWRKYLAENADVAAFAGYEVVALPEDATPEQVIAEGRRMRAFLDAHNGIVK